MEDITQDTPLDQFIASVTPAIQAYFESEGLGSDASIEAEGRAKAFGQSLQAVVASRQQRTEKAPSIFDNGTYFSIDENNQARIY
ncbi:hypothetical protein [Hymenobacter wooponensis]|uniref:Uncharacterized protein n=1 Tax=Hymenobacter wooponensis TaxID=1525360 RepID=A0A4Z0MST9_9BACT|nr:hypothetical protein [Hymenobacter wooponensis]TGD82883.1 hypothetical protein EU557_03625 [Hymenobacter wooponensis]